MVILTTSVSSGVGPGQGQVNLCDATAQSCFGIHLLGSAQLTNSGTAVFRLRPGIGPHSYRAQYVGTNTFAASASSVASLTVNGTFLTSTQISQAGTVGDYSLTATVVGTVNSTASPAPTGNVSFVDTTSNNTALRTAGLGAATLGLNFVNSSNPTTVTEPNVVATADFNGDGIPDLAVSNSNSGATELTILLGKGDGTFTPAPSNPTVGLYPDSIAVGDFNSDGIVDLAVTSVDQDLVTILLGKGDGTFTASASTLPTSSSPQSVVAADFNGDGRLDLAVSNGSSLLIFLGQGDGTFQAPLSNTVATSGLVGLVAADFNGDGAMDLAVADGLANNIQILLGNGDGTFHAPLATSAISEEPEALAVDDFNGDGIPDLAVSSYGGTPAIYTLLGNGNGTFQSPVPKVVPGVDSMPSIVPADLNGDGKADLVVGCFSCGPPQILLGNGDGTFTAGPEIGPQLPPNSEAFSSASGYVAVADFNGDGAPDLAEPNQDTNGTVGILLTQPTFTASATVTNISPSGPGPHDVEAQYAGDSNYAPSTSSTSPLLVQVATPVLSLSSGSYSSGQTLTISDATPNATIQYSLYTGTVNPPVLTYTGPITLSGSGVQAVQATAQENGYQPSGIASATYTVGSVVQPAMTFQASSTSITSSQPITFNISVKGPSGMPVPTGGIQFAPGSALYAPLPMTNGNVSLTLGPNRMPVGNDTMVATYVPDAASAGTYIGTTQSLLITVAGAGTLPALIQVTPTSQTVNEQQDAWVSVQVEQLSPGYSPTGSITETAGTFVTQMSVGSILPVIPAGSLPLGTSTVTLSYSGDFNFAPATATAQVTVTPLQAVNATSSAASPVAAGASTNSTISLLAGSAYTGTMNLQCALTASPTGAQALPTCSLSPASVSFSSGGSATTTLTVKTTASSQSTAAAQPAPFHLRSLGEGTALAALVLIGIPGKRRRKAVGWMAVLIFLAGFNVGCAGGGGTAGSGGTIGTGGSSGSSGTGESGGSSGSSGTGGSGGTSGGSGTGGGTSTPATPATTPGSYTFTVTGVDSNNPNLTVSANVNVTVQ